MRFSPLLLCLLLACGCSDGETTGGGGAAGQGGGEPAGCEPGELETEDGCVGAGVPAEACAEGFEPVADGCEPILPDAPCPPGQLAIPGELDCRDVAPCGEGTWGLIPVEASTQYVDASHVGASDGSAAQPWVTVQAGVDAAAAGAVVAIAAGSYAESVEIEKSVRLWGRCPSLVSIDGIDPSGAAVFVRAAGDGAEVHDLALSGAGMGLAVLGGEQIVADQLWLHDTDRWGIAVGDDGPASVTVSRTLVESATEMGIFDSAAQVAVHQSVVRSTRPAGAAMGRGVAAQVHSETLARARLEIRASVIESSQHAGVFVGGSDAHIEATVVRGTLAAQASEGGRGDGISVRQSEDGTVRSSATIRSCLVEQNTSFGVSVRGSDVEIDASAIRDTLPDELGTAGRALQIDGSLDGLQQAAVEVRSSLLERNQESAVVVAGSTALLESVLVRDTLSQAAGQTYGRGVTVQFQSDVDQRSSATLRGCVLADSRDIGLAVVSSDVVVEHTVVRDTLPNLAFGAFGDGVIAMSEYAGPASVSLMQSLVSGSARAGLASFGASMQLQQSELRCNTIQLTAQEYQAAPYQFDDHGGNHCGCGEVQEGCTLIAADLEPATPL